MLAVMVAVEISIKASNGKFFVKEIVCLRPHPGDDLLVEDEEFSVRAVALPAGEAKVLCHVSHRKKLTARALIELGFFPA